MEIKIIRSPKRKRSVSARMVGDLMRVNAPANMPEATLQKIVVDFQKRFEKRALRNKLNITENLADICNKLNKKYFEGKISVKSIEYVTDQVRKWGVCNSMDKAIRISHRLAEMPQWVRDYVVVHEMAHILEPNHSADFWKLVNRYELSERARGYLIAKGLEKDTEEMPNEGQAKTTDTPC
jgi:predicted metal-dependent hydrolase